jgi:hypothetical protein
MTSMMKMNSCVYIYIYKLYGSVSHNICQEWCIKTTIQYNTTQHNKIQQNTIQHNTMPWSNLPLSIFRIDIYMAQHPRRCKQPLSLCLTVFQDMLAILGIRKIMLRTANIKGHCRNCMARGHKLLGPLLFFLPIQGSVAGCKKMCQPSSGSSSDRLYCVSVWRSITE